MSSPTDTRISRRSCLKALVAGALVTRTLGDERVAAAEPATPPAAVVSIFLEGGLNAIFASADSFRAGGTFGVAPGNVAEIGNGLFVDAGIGALGEWARGHMAAIGVRHGSTDHASAQRLNFSDGTRSFALQLAAAMPGTAAFKAAALGSLPPGPVPAETGVSIQLLRTTNDALTALGLGEVNTDLPARNVAAGGIDAARTMSGAAVSRNPRSLAPFHDGYTTQVDALRKPISVLDAGNVLQAYRVGAGAKLESVASKLAAAELMIRGGTNVLTIRDGGWDTHGDRTGSAVRQRMNGDILPPLKTFLARLRSDPALAGRNVSVVLHGDFARSLPSSDHATALSALVIGPNVKVGTTGRMARDATLPAGTGGTREMWSYLAALARVPANPFGPNPHALVR